MSDKPELTPDQKAGKDAVNRIRNNAAYNPEWRKLLDRVNHFSNWSRRNQSNALFFLIERGLELMEKEEADL